MARLSDHTDDCSSEQPDATKGLAIQFSVVSWQDKPGVGHARTQIAEIQVTTKEHEVCSSWFF